MLYNIFGDKMDCIFCKIVAGEIPAKKVYEDELVMAFLDVSPHTDGHTLIIPKKHYKDILEMDDEILTLFVVIFCWILPFELDMFYLLTNILFLHKNMLLLCYC